MYLSLLQMTHFTHMWGYCIHLPRNLVCHGHVLPGNLFPYIPLACNISLLRLDDDNVFMFTGHDVNGRLVCSFLGKIDI